MTLKDFNILWNEYRAQLSPPHHPVILSLQKRKTVKEAVTRDELSPNGIPRRIIVEPKVTRVEFDTNAFNDICSYLWEYYLGSKMKRISSEGKWRPGIGFIKSENRGFADMLGGADSISFYLETKRRSETHLKSQLKFAEWVRSFNGYYISARSFEDAFTIVQIIKSKQYELLKPYEAMKSNKARETKGDLFG